MSLIHRHLEPGLDGSQRQTKGNCKGDQRTEGTIAVRLQLSAVAFFVLPAHVSNQFVASRKEDDCDQRHDE